jgi:site-specific DNA-adenine methylase
LWRVNQRGEMNTPPRDKLSEIHLPTVPELLECASALEGASLLDWDFRRYEEDENMFIGPGTLVFVDPPYDGDGAFRQYTADGFTETDQRDLVRLASEWSARGATVIYTNASTPLVRDLLDEEWPRADIEVVDVKRPVACKAESRAPVPEIIAYERP